MSLWGQLIFQDANSYVMENMIFFHDHAMLVIMLILALILYMLSCMLINSYTNRYLLDGQMIEIIWTIFPILFLIFLALPSLKILYLTDEVNDPVFTVKVVGHQWYWSYEYDDFTDLSYDSFMISTDSLNDLFRLLDVDNRMILPMNVFLRLLVTSDDVIHCFAVPALGVKIDAVPGRMNQVCFSINRPGVYYGQCSEICGANHSFMPIVMEVIHVNDFEKFLIKLSDYGKLD